MVNLNLSTGERKYVIAAVLLICIFGVTIFLLSGRLKNLPTSALQNALRKKPVVGLKTTYKNPFDKKTQYVNPFEKNKNPFVTNR